MLIISNFHDYYDTAMGMGIDKTCVYSRASIVIEKRRNYSMAKDPLTHTTITYKRKLYDVCPTVIGFCGKIIPMIVVTESSNKTFYRSAEEWETFLESVNSKSDSKYSWWWGITNKKEYTTFFDDSYLRKYEELFVVYSTPIFSIEAGVTKTVTTINPNLKDFDFVKVVDPYTAFQEVYMYISGVLGIPERSTVTLSDVDKRDKKGFDKFSFKHRK